MSTIWPALADMNGIGGMDVAADTGPGESNSDAPPGRRQERVNIR